MSISSKLVERLDVENAIRPQNITGAGADGDWIKFTGQRVLIELHTGAWAGGTSAVTLQQATSAAGAGAKALGMTRMWKKTTGLFAETAVASDTFDLDTANAVYLIEVDAAELDVDNDFAYLRVRAASPGANDDFLQGAYVIGDLRYGTLIEDREDAKA